MTKVKRRPRVSTIEQAGKIAYKFACGLCDQEPLFGKDFRRHLVTAHKMRDRTAINLVTRAARTYKERINATPGRSGDGNVRP